MGIKHAAAFLVLFLAFQNSQALGQVVAKRTDATGNWSNAANWSTNTVPNNGGGTHLQRGHRHNHFQFRGHNEHP